MDDQVRKLFEEHLDPDSTRELDALLARALGTYLREPELMSAFDSEALAQQFRSTVIPNAPMDSAEYLKWMFQQVLPNAVKVHAPRFVGHMTSGLPNFTASLTTLMTTLNQNVVKLETSDAFTAYERQALGMLHRLVFRQSEEFYQAHVQRNDSTLGMMVSGGTLGNIAALWTARNSSFSETSSGGIASTDGVTAALKAKGSRRAVVVGSTLMHYSLRKAADLLGIGEDNLVRIPVGTDSRIRLDELERCLVELKKENATVVALVGIAGTTETGAVDPLEEMAGLARKYGMPFHVDAAWGGPVLFSSRHRHLLRGIELADTVTIDGHKQLYVPMGIGMVLFKDPERARVIEKSANYIVRVGSVDLGRRTLEGSRPALSIFLHGALNMIGASGYEQLIDEGIEKANWLANIVRKRSDFELLADPELNIVNYRFLPPRLRDNGNRTFTNQENQYINRVNVGLQELQRESRRSFISRTLLTNTRYGTEVPIVTLRSVLANPLTLREHLLEALEEQAALGKQTDAKCSLERTPERN